MVFIPASGNIVLGQHGGQLFGAVVAVVEKITASFSAMRPSPWASEALWIGLMISS